MSPQITHVTTTPRLITGAGDKAQWVRVFAALPDDPHSVSTVYNSSSRGTDALLVSISSRTDHGAHAHPKT